MHNARILQDGTPRDLYQQPATRFSADFIGNANVLPITLTRESDGFARVTLGTTTMRLPNRNLPDGPAEIAIRPEPIRIRPRGNGNELAGVVRRRPISAATWNTRWRWMANDFANHGLTHGNLLIAGTPELQARLEAVVRRAE